MYFLHVILLVYPLGSICIRHEGDFGNKHVVFEKFVHNYLELLAETKCSEEHFKNYARLMYKEINQMDYKYAKNLAKIFKEWSHKDSYVDDVITDAKLYLEELEKDLPKRNEFFKAINELFALVDSIRLDDYIYDLKDYLNEDKYLIEEETHKVLYEIILSKIERLGRKQKKKLKKKLKAAIEEYEEIELAEYIKMHNITTPTLLGRLD